MATCDDHCIAHGYRYSSTWKLLDAYLIYEQLAQIATLSGSDAGRGRATIRFRQVIVTTHTIITIGIVGCKGVA